MVLHQHVKPYADRRLKILTKMSPNSVCFIAANKKVMRNGDAEYPFRQNSSLYHVSGWPEDLALLVLTKKNNEHNTVFFCHEQDVQTSRWVGERLGTVRAKQDYGMEEAYLFEELEARLPDLLIGAETLYYPLCEQEELETIIKDAIKILHKQKRKGYLIPKQHIDSSGLLDELRLVKMPDEIALMAKAATISAHAHIRGMKTCKPEMAEYELEAEYRYEFLRRGAQDVAYMPIVASGPNACILHYINNNRKMRDQELVLVDAGCEYQGYASDITRTFPVNGKFTKDQQAVYEIVLAAQEAALQVANPSYTWEKMQEAVVSVLVQGLIDLKILKGELNYLIEQGAYKPYYMHQSGHWLGLDVHDAGDYKVHNAWRQLEPGMVLTIEPGLYFPQEDQSLPDKYRGLGIRIEDDILITSQEPDILSKEVPKTVREIEQLMRT